MSAPFTVAEPTSDAPRIVAQGAEVDVRTVLAWAIENRPDLVAEARGEGAPCSQCGGYGVVCTRTRP